MRILITGPQGSGKTTQAEILAKKLGIALIEAGEILRQLAETDCELGQLVKEELAAGRLVKDEIIAQCIKEKVVGLGEKASFVGDGYPRTLESLQDFDPDYDIVFYLDMADSEVEKRLLARGRADDTPVLIKERLKEYHQRTEPVLNYYANLGKLIKISGEGSIEEIAQDIEGQLRKHQINE